WLRKEVRIGGIEWILELNFFRRIECDASFALSLRFYLCCSGNSRCAAIWIRACMHKIIPELGDVVYKIIGDRLIGFHRETCIGMTHQYGITKHELSSSSPPVGIVVICRSSWTVRTDDGEVAQLRACAWSGCGRSGVVVAF